MPKRKTFNYTKHNAEKTKQTIIHYIEATYGYEEHLGPSLGFWNGYEYGFDTNNHYLVMYVLQSIIGIANPKGIADFISTDILPPEFFTEANIKKIIKLSVEYSPEQKRVLLNFDSFPDNLKNNIELKRYAAEQKCINPYCLNTNNPDEAKIRFYLEENLPEILDDYTDYVFQRLTDANNRNTRTFQYEYVANVITLNEQTAPKFIHLLYDTGNWFTVKSILEKCSSYVTKEDAIQILEGQPYNIQYSFNVLPEYIRQDKDFLMACTDKGIDIPIDKIFENDIEFFKQISNKTFKAELDIQHYGIRHSTLFVDIYHTYLKYFSDDIKDNKQLMLPFIKQNIYHYYHLSKRLQNDKDILHNIFEQIQTPHDKYYQMEGLACYIVANHPNSRKIFEQIPDAYKTCGMPQVPQFVNPKIRNT